MTYTIGALVIIVAVQAAAIVILLTRRSRRARGEKALRESEAQFRGIAEQAPVMVWTTKPDQMLDYFNSTCMKFTGLPIERLLGEGWLNTVHPDDLEHCSSIYVPAFQAGVPFRMEYRMRRADGVYRWILDVAVPKYENNGSFAGYIGCSIDITERRDAEDRIRELAGRLIEAQDAERARVARDLHDDVSQQLAGLSIAFSALRQQLTASSTGDVLLEELRALQQRTTAIAQSVRHLSHDLHPTVLRHAGLVAALTSYCAELERTHGTVFTFKADGDFGSVSEEASLCLYRIAQEALRNVIAHAGAARADVRVLRDGDIVEVTIADDGKGFDVASSLMQSNGLGLVSMTERVRLAGGAVDIEAEAANGTRVRARVPAGPVVRSDAAGGGEPSEYNVSYATTRRDP